MTDKRSNGKATLPTGRQVLEHAADIATLSDRWFVSLAGGLGRLGRVRNESAARSSEDGEQRPESEGDAAPRTSSRFDVVSASAADEWSPLASGRRVRDDSLDGGDCPEERPAAEGTHSAGVLPLLQALARVVAEHADDEYRTLDEDERLWTLIELLQALGAPGQRTRAGGAEPQHEPHREAKG